MDQSNLFMPDALIEERPQQHTDHKTTGTPAPSKDYNSMYDRIYAEIWKDLSRKISHIHSIKPTQRHPKSLAHERPPILLQTTHVSGKRELKGVRQIRKQGLRALCERCYALGRMWIDGGRKHKGGRLSGYRLLVQTRYTPRPCDCPKLHRAKSVIEMELHLNLVQWWTYQKRYGDETAMIKEACGNGADPPWIQWNKSQAAMYTISII